jgi:cyclopropane-fatty-acyl-phospholipid synthase
LWLDPQLVYSCAYFRKDSDDLELAQQQKLDHICRKLDLKPGDRLLDIGCGWGALVFWAARHYGVHATGITLSQNQYQYVAKRIWYDRLQNRCQVHRIDYRDIDEKDQYDKIASVGMFEHVGIKNLPFYFGKIDRLLKPGGLVMNHGITSAATEGAGLNNDLSNFVDRYVFPDGDLTHVSHVVRAMSEQNLEFLDAECLRPHYAKTLWHWIDRLETNKQEAVRLVGEEKVRIWQIYMAGSAWAFERGWLSIYQLLAGKSYADGSLPYPLTREHVYSKRNRDSNVVALGKREPTAPHPAHSVRDAASQVFVESHVEREPHT